MSGLEILSRNSGSLLLAEAVGWLHDYRKCSDEHLKVQSANLKDQQPLSKNCLKDRHKGLADIIIKLPIQETSRNVLELLDDKTRNNDLLGQILTRCHHTAHFDKQEPAGGKQDYPGTKISTPFGYEKEISSDLTDRLWALPWDKLTAYSESARKELRAAVSALFSETVADTRRPIDEVDLWSWGLLVAALYKAALAGALLSGTVTEPSELHWRLLAIRVNGLDYLLQVTRIPDLLARQKLLSASLDRVQHLLEVIYPLGTEVYRDENGSIFVVPDVPDLLDRTDDSGIDLQALILQAFSEDIDGKMTPDIKPDIKLEEKPWWGQDPKWTKDSLPASLKDELPGIGALLCQEISSPPEVEKIEESWSAGETTDICTVCGLRPQGPGNKAIDRNVCDTCEERRAERSKEWATSRSNETIWTDELADDNGRLALVVGQFDLTHWLDGRMLESLLVIAPHDPENKNNKSITSKTPSFSRLRRIWETTRQFWQEVQAESLKKPTADRLRLEIHIDAKPSLGSYHVYDLVVGQTALNLVWVPKNKDSNGYFISADNLGYIARQLGADRQTYIDPALAAHFIADYLEGEFVTNGRQPILRNPDARAGQDSFNLLAGKRITQVERQKAPYSAAIPILAEPRRFMILVPADRSLAIIDMIKKKYEGELGKVRDRLPLHLGVIYAGRRTPIRSVLEAGHAMLDMAGPADMETGKGWEDWRLENIAHSNNGERELTFANGITWRISVQTGDVKIEDRWYPRFYVGDTWERKQWKHIDKLSARESNLPVDKDCRVWVRPSRFDFEFLDTNARRYEIHYNKEGRRPRRTRPFYLEDLDRLERLWKALKPLNASQAHQVIYTIEATRERWFGRDNGGRSLEDDVFRQFVADTLAGAAWPPGKPWRDIPAEWQEKLIRSGGCGELADLAEWHLEILKEKG